MTTTTKNYNRTLSQECSKLICSDQVATPRYPQDAAGYGEHTIFQSFSSTTLGQDQLFLDPQQSDQLALFGVETDPFLTALWSQCDPITVEDKECSPPGSQKQDFDWSQNPYSTLVPASSHTSTPAPKTELSHSTPLLPNNMVRKKDPMLSSIPRPETDLEAEQETTNASLFSQGL